MYFISPPHNHDNFFSVILFDSHLLILNRHVIYLFQYGCGSLTLTTELEMRTQAFEMKCYQRLSSILYKDHITNERVHRKIQVAIGEYDGLLTLVKKQKLRCFGHVSRS